MSEILVSLLLLAGTTIILAGSVGLIRFPDVYNRMHAAGMGTTLGSVGILLAGSIYFSIHFGLTLKLLLVIPFLFWTASAGSFMIARAAHRTGPDFAAQTVRDDLSSEAGITPAKQ